MTRSVLLNSATGQLETTQVLPVAALRPVPCFKEVIYDGNNRITGVNIRASNGGAILYSRAITRSGGQIVSITETDNTRSPAISRTKTISRTAGFIIGVEVT